jgi:hypothetical protein
VPRKLEMAARRGAATGLACVVADNGLSKDR